MAFDKTAMNAEVTNARSIGAMPLMAWIIDFDGDDAYPAGGTPDFTAFVKSVTGRNITVLGVVANNCGGYLPQWDATTDKLWVYRVGSTNSPMADTPPGDLSSTRFSLTVFAT